MTFHRQDHYRQNKEVLGIFDDFKNCYEKFGNKYWDSTLRMYNFFMHFYEAFQTPPLTLTPIGTVIINLNQ